MRWSRMGSLRRPSSSRMLTRLTNSTSVDLRFGWVIRDNQFTSRRFNDGIQLATDPKFNPAPADYVVPFGSDDWAD